jgi:DNA-binding NtrC family response regulator
MAAKGNILVVDNESDQLMMMKEILRRIGYRAKTAENPHDALKMIAEEAFSMVFIDLIMPDIDGTELCEQIKEMRPSVRVYAFSGHTHLYRPDQLERAGFDGSLNKPATIEEISAFLADAGKNKPKRKR